MSGKIFLWIVPSQNDTTNLLVHFSAVSREKQDSHGFNSTSSELLLLLFEVLSEMTEKAEDIEKMLKLFFKAGVTPEFAENYLEANALTGGLELFLVFFQFKTPPYVLK